jgi:hypothetical protein
VVRACRLQGWIPGWGCLARVGPWADRPIRDSEVAVARAWEVDR